MWMIKNNYEKDKIRYGEHGKMPRFQIYLRKYQISKGKVGRLICKFLFAYYRRRNLVDMSIETKIGGGLYIGHPYGITINPQAVIGEKCNIHKGVTIGQENRGKRKGTPVIGDEVWIGINATIVGKILIGSDVLIAPNKFVNKDIPDHSVVFGNPCVIIPNTKATEEYICNKA